MLQEAGKVGLLFLGGTNIWYPTASLHVRCVPRLLALLGEATGSSEVGVVVHPQGVGTVPGRGVLRSRLALLVFDDQ